MHLYKNWAPHHSFLYIHEVWADDSHGLRGESIYPAFQGFLYLAHPPQQMIWPKATDSLLRKDKTFISRANKRTKGAVIRQLCLRFTSCMFRLWAVSLQLRYGGNTDIIVGICTDISAERRSKLWDQTSVTQPSPEIKIQKHSSKIGYNNIPVCENGPPGESKCNIHSLFALFLVLSCQMLRLVHQLVANMKHGCSHSLPLWSSVPPNSWQIQIEAKRRDSKQPRP